MPWFEEYKCGCVSEVVKTKRELEGYCGKHGSDRRHIHRADQPEKSIERFAEQMDEQKSRSALGIPNQTKGKE